MATALSATVTAKINSVYTNSLDLGESSTPQDLAVIYSLTNGAGAGKVNTPFSDTRTLGNGANEELDLSGGLTDAYGTSIVYTKIKAMMITADAANGSTISVGGSASNGFDTWVGATGDLVKVNAGGVLLLAVNDANGYAVTASTGDLLKITNDDGAASANYSIQLLGEV